MCATAATTDGSGCVGDGGEANVAASRHRRGSFEASLLQRNIECHVHRRARLRGGELVSLENRRYRGVDRSWLIVPFDEGANQCRLVSGRVQPVDPRTPPRSVNRTGRADDEDGNAIAERVEDRHRCMHEPDIAVQSDRHRSAGDLGVRVRNRHRVLLVQAEDDPRVAVSEVIDDAVVQATKARARIEGDVLDVKGPNRARDLVATPGRYAVDARWLIDFGRSHLTFQHGSILGPRRGGTAATGERRLVECSL
jgi:hypothetical protein